MSLDFETRRLLKQRVSEAVKARVLAREVAVAGGACSSCGTPLNLCQPGCKRCMERHRSRLRRARHAEVFGKGQCAGCGVSVERHYTVGCSVCYDRKRKRQLRMAA